MNQEIDQNPCEQTGQSSGTAHRDSRRTENSTVMSMIVLDPPERIPPQHRPKGWPSSRRKRQTLAEMNAELAATRSDRLAIAEENCRKMTGRSRL
jgi:hypothetical protein